MLYTVIVVGVKKDSVLKESFKSTKIEKWVKDSLGNSRKKGFVKPD